MSSVSRHIVACAIKGYQVGEKLGSGSYSTVFKAKCSSLNKDVAIKCIEKAKLSESGKENIINEIRIMKMLDHPFIVKLYDFLWDDKFIYLILEYCDGGDLSSFIKRRRRLPEKTFQKFFSQLAMGLQFLRSQNICHFDLKPQNLLLCSHPKITLKIADFGFAQFLSLDAHKTSVRGSPLYMAPEMLLKRDYTAKADLWSVGIIAFECLFGKPPLPHSTCCQLLKSIREEVPLEIPKHVVSSECEDLVSRLLVYDSFNRIDFDEFFNHPFLDLEHYPSEESYNKAVELIHKAVKHDYNKEYQESFNVYCQALQYLVPYVNDLDNLEKKENLKKKVLEYTKRAEELKSIFQNIPSIKRDRGSTITTFSQETTDSHDSSIYSSTPAIKSAVEMGCVGQMYLVEGEYELALEKLKSALSVLVPLLQNEPLGSRRDHLYKQVQDWLSQAENVKILLSVQQNTKVDDHKDSCSIQ